MRRLALLALLVLLPVVASLAGAREERGAAKPHDDDFLAEVELLATEAERAAYLAIEKPYQRQEFERRFWAVRDPYPQTPRNELADRWHERWALAEERYPHLDDDRRAVLLLAGEPARTIRIRCAQLLRVGEIWAYTRTDAIPQSFVLVFLTGGVSEAVPHHLWTARGGLHDAFAAGGGDPFGTAGSAAERIVEECPRGQDVISLLASASDWNELVRHYPVVPHPDPEWVHAFQSASTDLPAGAPALPGEVEVRFSGRNQSRTVVDAAVLVAAADFASGAGLVLDGEVLRGDELFDQFRYRFDPPSGIAPRDRVPFAARRFLRPGDYTLVLRLHDPATGRYFRAEQPLAVPPPAEAERALAEWPRKRSSASPPPVRARWRRRRRKWLPPPSPGSA
jgi:GWxTD domain-containing protein